jgi:hypothetical protein
MRTLLLLFLANVYLPIHSDNIIDVSFQQRNAIALVKIGDEKLRVLVDSGGSSGISIRRELTTKLGIQPSDIQTESEDAFGKKTISVSLIVPKLVIGSESFFNIEGKIWNAPRALQDLKPQIDGVIGRKFLNQFNVIYNFPDKSIQLIDKEKPLSPYCKGVHFDISYIEDGALTSTIKVQEGPLTILWDTGASYSFIKESVVTNRKLKVTDQIYRTKFIMDESMPDKPIDFIALGFHKPDSIDAIIGHDVFLKNKICIDNQNSTVTLSSNN